MFSYFKNDSQKIPMEAISIQELHAQLVKPDRVPFIETVNLIQHLRAATTEAEEKLIKSQLPAFCPGARVDTRAASATQEQKNIKYSGFMQIDIDLKDNPNMTDAKAIRDKVALIPYVVLSAISARGKGVWCLIALEQPGKIVHYADQIFEYFKRARVTIDKSKSKNPTELRYFSPDPGAILKTDYKLFPLVKSIPKPVIKYPATTHTGTALSDIQKWVMETTGYNLVDGQKHYYLFWLSYAMRKNGMTETEIYELIYGKVLQSSYIKSNCISGGIAYANAKGIYTPQTRISAPQHTIKRTVLVTTQAPENSTQANTHQNQYIPLPDRSNQRHDYIGIDGILHNYIPGLPELN